MRCLQALCAIAFATVLLPSSSRGQSREQVDRYRRGAEAEIVSPVVIVPIVNHDNNQHASNENLRLRNLWDGMVVFSALFTGLGAAWQ